MMSTSPKRFSVALAAVLATVLAAAPASAQSEARLAMAQRFLDQDKAAQALEIVESVLRKDKKNARGVLLRSTARIMSGDLSAGFKDLQRALKLDPSLRQGWLNLAGLEIAERRYEAAYDALVTAQKLDPSAPDSDLNLGAVLVMQGYLEKAERHFDRYLAALGASAEAQFLVASNYALADSEELAIEHLRRSIRIDERYRMKARSNERFLGLNSLDYKVLLNTDAYTPPAGAHQVVAAYRVPYRQSDNELLYAVLNALQQLEMPYDPKIEANPRWALIWAGMRIKVADQSDGTGVVSLSAPKESFADDEWHRLSQELFRAIHQILGGP